MPRFKGENFERNIELVRTLEASARARRDGRPAALAWVMAQGEGIIQSGHDEKRASRRADRRHGHHAVGTELDAIERAFQHAVAGDRYMANMRAFIDH